MAELVADIHGAGPVAVLLLHGQPGTAGDWKRLTPLLDGRYTAVAPDRPGYGRTGGGATGFTGNARAAMDLLDRLDLASAVLVGHSWAGGVCLAAASTWPERVRGLVLVSSVGPGEHLGWGDRLLAAPVLGEALAAATIGGLALLLGRARVQELVDRRLAGRAHEAVAELTSLTRGGTRVWRSFVSEQRALFDELDDLAAGLGSIRAPTVVVHGRADRIVAPSVAESVAAAIPGATLRLLPGVGHLVPHDRPQAIVEALDTVAAG